MFWNFVVIAIAWIISGAIFGIGLGQIFIILRTALPITNRLSVMFPKGVDRAGIKRRCNITITFWAVILAAVVVVLIVWENVYVRIGAGVGALFALFSASRAGGPSQTNVAEYIKTYGSLMTEDVVGYVLRSYGEKNGD